MKDLVMKFVGKGGACVVLALFLLASTAPAAAQKNSKDKKKKPATNSSSSADTRPLLPGPDTQVVDRVVGEYLGYWQIGDIESMHRYCAPVIGWDNFVRAYQAQRALVTGGRMDRSNTYIKVDGNSAWATYLFFYAATVDGKAAGFRGHTTLVLNKRGDRWVIVLNHSSVVSATDPTSSAGPAQPRQP